MKGFWIYRIMSSKDGSPDAVIDLKKGANVITGPSDTGKSYLFSVINYVLGRTAEPDQDIPEGRGYNSFSLGIQTHKDEISYWLTRELGENKIVVSKVTNTGLTFVGNYLARVALKNSNNISNFLLGLCELNDSILLKNKLEGKKQLLSFKNIIQFTNVAEDRIITKSSPFYFTNNNSNHILEQSMISLILDGQDFSDVEGFENNKVRETRISGQLEFIEKQIIDYSERRMSISRDIESLSKNYEGFNDVFLRGEIEVKLKESYKLEEEITSRLEEITYLTDKKNYHKELINRFKILERLYLSDIDRLGFIIEAESLTAQLPTHLCPICTNPMDDSHLDHLMEIKNFRESVVVESQIIEAKVSDLKSTIADSEDKIRVIQNSLEIHRNGLDNLTERNLKLAPEVSDLKVKLSGYLDLKRLQNNLEFIDIETESLYETSSHLDELRKKRETTDVVNVCDYEVLKKLSVYIQNRLEKWEYESSVKVIFNGEFQVFDIIISGKGRGAFGKGKRAISYSACLLGFLDYCLSESRNFSNLIVLDSPLTTFKGAQKDEQSEEELVGLDDSFFKDLNETSHDAQVIIFENKVPPTFKNLNVIEFTRSKDYGRYGFYPV